MGRDGTEDLGHLRKLLGELAGKRLLVLGAGTDEVVTLARGGATVIALDPDAGRVDAARRALETAELKAEVRAGDLADLAFLRADSVDGVVSAGALASLGDLDRLFRQVQRVLRPGAPFAFTLPHPAGMCVTVDAEPAGSLPLASPALSRSYFDPAPVQRGGGGPEDSGLTHPHTIATVFTGLTRAGYRVDVIGEPEPPRGARGQALVPDLVVWRARKEGS